MTSRYVKIAPAILGFCALSLAIYFNDVLSFDPYYLIGQSEAWAFGPREGAHFFGMMAGPMIGWAYLTSFATRKSLQTTLALVVLLYVWMFVCGKGPEAVTSYMGREIVRQFIWPIVLLPFVSVICFGISKGARELINPLPALLATCVPLAIWSIGWEIIEQPFFNVYGAAPRGWIQFSQVISDFAGMGLGSVVVLSVISAQKSNSNDHAQIQDQGSNG